MQKLVIFFFQQKILAYGQSLNDTLTNGIVGFEQLGAECKRGGFFILIQWFNML